MSSNEREQFYKLLKSFNNAMLVTHTEDGSLRARPMALAQTQRDGYLWFATDMDSPKIDEIKQNPMVNITLQDEGKYLSISGTAEVIKDSNIVQELWTPSWKVYFPEGKDDPNLVLIRVNAGDAEYWDRHGSERLKFWFRAAKGYVQGKKPDFDAGDAHAKFNF